MLGPMLAATVGAGGPTLPPAVPAYRHDPGEAARRLGEAHLYIAQLTALLHDRATEANRLHDEVEAARVLVAELRAETDALRDARMQTPILADESEV